MWSAIALNWNLFLYDVFASFVIVLAIWACKSLYLMKRKKWQYLSKKKRKTIRNILWLCRCAYTDYACLHMFDATNCRFESLKKKKVFLYRTRINELFHAEYQTKQINGRRNSNDFFSWSSYYMLIGSATTITREFCVYIQMRYPFREDREIV